MITMRALLLSSIPLIALSSVPAAAQAPQTAEPAADEDVAQIIVTGTRRTDRTLADSPVP